MTSPDQARKKLAESRTDYESAAAKLEQARAKRREAVLAAKAAELNMTEIAELVGLSRHSAHAIVRAAE